MIVCAAVLPLFVMCLAGGTAAVPSSQKNLHLVDRGYEGLTVAITDDIPQDHCAHIIHGLKNVLREFSRVLYVSTSGRASLREATVVLPRSWHKDAPSCGAAASPGTITPRAAPLDSQIVITGPHPVFGANPWAQQSQGCGRPGDVIRMGGDLLRTATNDSHAHAARLLLAEWAKFRWGVFEERGDSGDPLYPPLHRGSGGTGEWLPTVCTNGRVHGTRCDPSHPGCAFTPEPYSNAHITSSVLALPQLPSVRNFCDGSTHVSSVPTKHNAMCSGRSAWEIIRRHTDFEQHSSPAYSKAWSSTVNLVQEVGPRYIFLIEDTTTMILQRRWEFLRKALRRVVVYDVPDGSYVGVVTFNSKPRIVAPLTFIDSKDSDFRQRVGSSLPRNPSRVPESHKCLLCSIQEGLTLLHDDNTDAQGATIIIVTSGSGPPAEKDMKEMLHLAQERNLQYQVVIYPVTEQQDIGGHGLAELSAKTGGATHSVMDEGVGNDSKVTMMLALMDALLSVVSLASPADSSGAPVLVHSQAYPGGISSISAGSFALDSTLAEDARFSIYYYDLNHVGNSIELKTPSGQTLASVNMQEEDGDVNMIFVNLEKAERGLWTYTVENRADSHQGLYIQVTSRRNTTEGLKVSLWTNTGSMPINASDPRTPTIIYASIHESNSPVINAKVIARVQRLGTNATGHNFEPIYVELLDNGIGDPDITGNDGVYSRYLPTLGGTPGRYLLSADLDYNNGMAVVAKAPPTRHHKPPSTYHYHHSEAWSASVGEQRWCCGSILQLQYTRRIQPFIRHLTWGVLEVVTPTPTHDHVPPSRIIDLQLQVNELSYEITLRWTAPGDDWDHGRAHHYFAVVAPSYQEARAFQGNQLTGLPQPLPTGATHTTTLLFVKYEELWYITIRAIDEAGNKGGLGNIAALWVPRPPTTYEITTRTQPALTTSGNYTMPSELGSGYPVSSSNLQIDLIIFGCIGGFLFVLTIIVVYCFVLVARRRKLKNKKDNESVNGDGIIKSRSVDEKLGSQLSLHGSGKENGQMGEEQPLQVGDVATLLNKSPTEKTVVMQHVDGQPIGGIKVGPFPDVTQVTDYPIRDSSVHDCPPRDPPPYSAQQEINHPAYHSQNYSHSGVQPHEYIPYTTTAAWAHPLGGHLLTQSHGPILTQINPQMQPQHPQS
ncbi:unnamed protein product, partial [Meganyctiphanes norvegica]